MARFQARLCGSMLGMATLVTPLVAFGDTVPDALSVECKVRSLAKSFTRIPKFVSRGARSHLERCTCATRIRATSATL
jgi:hypothetical protein